jgi:hypothetical protein
VLGGDVVVFNGEAELEQHAQAVDPGYVKKYLTAAAEWGHTPQDLYKEYSVAIRIVPTRVRTF